MKRWLSSSSKPTTLAIVILFVSQCSPSHLDDIPEVSDDFNLESLLGPSSPGMVHPGGEVLNLGGIAIPGTLNTLAHPGNVLVQAVAVLRGLHTYGVVRLTQIGSGPVHIAGIIKGLYPLAQHGLHVHEYSASGPVDCESAGEHYNPTKQSHGPPDHLVSHVGDLGNVQANAKGLATFSLTSSRLSLTGKLSVIQRSLVVHQNMDDLGSGWDAESRKSGNSGSRLACGTIKFVKLTKN